MNELNNSKKQERILVVDDEGDLLEVVKMMLEHLGYHVLTSLDGSAAMEIIKNEGDISLVILDLSMPDLSGVETLERILEINPAQKVIISSGFRGGDSVDKTLAMGAKCFIQKPYKMQELAATIRDVINKDELAE